MLHAAGWEDDFIREQLVLTPGRIVPLGEQKHFRKEGSRADYVLFIRKNIPIAVLEAKAEYKEPGDGTTSHALPKCWVSHSLIRATAKASEHDYTTGHEGYRTSFQHLMSWDRQRVW
jgi:type I restriction enzyme R subunit